MTLPLGMQLVHGTRIIVDSNAPLQGPYVICFQNGCMSDYEATPELIASLKKGQNLVVQAINSNGAPLTLPLPLAGEFAKAYDGPPTDPKVFEENQKKLQEELQKRAEEQRKKLEGAGAGAIRRRSKQPHRPTNTKGARTGRLFLVAAQRGCASSATDCAGDSRPTCPSRKSRPPANAGSARRNRPAAGFVRRRRRRIRIRIFREQVIERLVLVGPDLLGDRQPPLLGIVEFRIDIENHAPE